MSRSYAAELQVVRFIATKPDAPERGPHVWLNSEEARKRLLLEGEIAWVYGPRRHELAPVSIDDGIDRGQTVVRDIAGVTISEMVRVVKVDLDRAEFRRQHFG